MGRKIPGRKHRGVKDPEKQQQERYNRIKDKINAPPSNPDHQETPASLKRIINFKEKCKLAEERRKKKPNVNKKPVKRLKKKRTVLPAFQKYEDETDRAFMYRVNETVDTIIKEAEYEDKYNVEIKRNQETGEVEDIVKRPKDEIDELMKSARKNKNKKKKKKRSNEPKLTKSQKREQKLKLKKEKKTLMKMEDFEKFKDNVKFGDIVHAPPTLVTPRKVDKNKVPRAGQKDLLLKSVLSTSKKTPAVQFPSIRKTIPSKKPQNNEIDKTSKRKDLPVALRRQLERQRTEVVNAYRILKAKKNNFNEMNLD